jgi:Na+-driven multidrug efflux pump
VPLIARAAAAGDDVTMRRTVAQALTVAVVVGLTATASLELAALPLLSALGAPPSSPLFEPADAYLRTRALAAPAVLLVAVGTIASVWLASAWSLESLMPTTPMTRQSPRARRQRQHHPHLCGTPMPH